MSLRRCVLLVKKECDVLRLSFTFTVNGISGVSAGHYTAYAKNPRTDVWYYYNDEITSRQKPQDEDFSNAYILFYSRQGTNLKPCNI